MKLRKSLSEPQRMVVFMGLTKFMLRIWNPSTPTGSVVVRSTIQLLPKVYIANPETPHW